MAENIIEVENLSIRFRSKAKQSSSLFSRRGGEESEATSKWILAVDDVSFQIRAGETFGLTGETGSGKSTIARILVGLYKPTSGKVRVLGRTIDFKQRKDISFLRENIGLVFQDPSKSLNPRLTVRDIIAEGLRASHFVDKEEYEERISAIVQRVGLTKTALDAYPRELSGGQKQRVSLARALVVPKKLLILDEPTSSLDVSIQAQVLNTIKNLKNEFGLSYLFITHDMNVIKYMTSRLAVLFYGKMMEVGRTFDVVSNPAHPYTRKLMSNILALGALEKSNEEQGTDVSEHRPSPFGCRYRSVCPYAFERCVETPPMIQTSPDRSASCFLYLGPASALPRADKKLN